MEIKREKINNLAHINSKASNVKKGIPPLTPPEITPQLNLVLAN